jgi:integrase
MPKRSKALTDATIRTLRPRAKRYEVRDGFRPGLILRVEPDGRRTWTFRFGLRGARRVTLGPLSEGFGLAKARVAAEGVLAEVRAGKDPGAQRQEERRLDREGRARRKAGAAGEPPPGSFEDLARRYLLHTQKRFRLSTWKKETWYIQSCILPLWGARPARDLRRTDVFRLLDETREARGGVTGNRTLSVARRVLAWGVDREELEANPAAAVPRRYLFPESSRERALSREEVRALWPALDALDNPNVAAAWRLILLTGARPGEVLGMRWEDVGTDDGGGTVWEIPAESTKAQRVLRVPLSRQALAVLNSLRPISGGGTYVLPSPKGDERPLRWLSHSTMRLRAATGLERFTPHDLRRTAATWLGDMGTRPDVIERVLGHKLPGVAAVYNRADYGREVGVALARLGDRVEETVTGRERSNVVAIG